MLAPDTVLQSRYRITGQLGAGGMGTVYEALDQRLNTTVALKETHFTEERLSKQFEREAQLLARLRHPAMTRVIDHFTEADGQYLVMDYIAGEDLWEMIQRRGNAFSVDEVLQWADQLLDALDYLHSQDPPVIHRDIKPQNLKLTGRGQIILLDFGLAKGFAGQVSRVTTSGSIFGYTPNYAPLEQIQGTGTDPRSDLYSLAATLYHLLTGVIPPDALSRASANIGELPDPLRPANELNAQVSHELATILKHAMAQHPSKRFANAAAMREALQKAKKPQSLTASEVKPEDLPPTIISPAPTKAAREDRTSPPTPAKPDVARKKIEPAFAIASPAIAPSAPLETESANDYSPSFALPAQPAQEPKRWRWIVGSIVGLFIAVYLIVALIRNEYSPSQKTDISPAETSSQTDDADMYRMARNPDITLEQYNQRKDWYERAARANGDYIGSGTEDGLTHWRVSSELQIITTTTPTIHIDVNYGVVTLRGTTTNISKKMQAERISRNVKGVTAVINRISVTSG